MTATAARAPSWRAVSASRRGSSHGSEVPNQDAVRCEPLARPDGSQVWVAAIADGHGGSRYVRSDVGARTAVDVAVEAVRRALGDAPDEDPAVLLRASVPAIVEQWRQAVRAHAHSWPFTEAELALTGPGGGANLLTAYGATLLIAVVGEHGVAVAQVGDGDALVRSHGFATRPVPSDPRLVAGETTSLCLDTAVDDFRYAALPATAEPDLVLLATDGYGNSFAQADWWHALVGDVASFITRLGFPQLEQRLPDWLEESARVGGDDVTAVLVVREPLAVPVVQPGVAAVGTPARTLDLSDADGPEPGAQRPIGAVRRRGRPRLPVLAALGALLAVLTVVAAYMLFAPDAQRSPDGPVDPGSRTTTPPGDSSTDDSGKGERGDRQQGPRRGTSPTPTPTTPTTPSPIEPTKRSPEAPGGGGGSGEDPGESPEPSEESP